MGPHFTEATGTHLSVAGSAASLSFGGTSPFSLAVQFLAQAQASSAAKGRCYILLSKFQAGLRGEYRLGLDARLCPFFHREVEPWDMTAPNPVSARVRSANETATAGLRCMAL